MELGEGSRKFNHVLKKIESKKKLHTNTNLVNLY